MRGRRPARGPNPEVAAIVIAPHLTTLVKLAQLPKSSASASCTRPATRPSRSSSRSHRRTSGVDVIEARDGEPVTGYDVVVILRAPRLPRACRREPR